jgi:uncharacterized protein YndB with AHSA1/START domain
MTRARALKHVIRERAARTGERYTTARRHVLSAVAPRPIAPAAHSGPAIAPAPTATTVPTKGSVSEAKCIEKTGHGLEHWFAVLDRFGAVEKGHTAAARHLYADHQVPGWYSQGITVAYERARGVRGINQRCDGEYEVSVSKVLTATADKVIRAFTDARLRKRWIAGVDTGLAAALTNAVTSKTSKGFVVRPDGLGRFRYKWDDTTVQFYLQPRPNGKVSLVVQHTKLANAAAVDERRAQWKVAFKALGGAIE